MADKCTGLQYFQAERHIANIVIMAPYMRHAEQRYMYITCKRFCTSKALAREKKKLTEVAYRVLNTIPAFGRGACVFKYQRVSVYAGCPLAYSSRSWARIVYTSRATCSFLRNRRYTTVIINTRVSKTQSHQRGRSTYGDSRSGKDELHSSWSFCMSTFSCETVSVRPYRHIYQG